MSSFMATGNLGSLSQAGSGVPRLPLCGDFRRLNLIDSARSSESIPNHLTELLDFYGHGSYSPVNLHRPDARLECEGAPPIGDRRNRRTVIEPQGHVSRSVAQWQLAS